MTIKRLLERALEGGWKPKGWEYKTIVFDGVSRDNTEAMFSNEHGEGGIWREFPIEIVFLDPLFWQAAGKVEGWEEFEDTDYLDHSVDMYYQDKSWKVRMHRMIDALSEGKTLEQFVETL